MHSSLLKWCDRRLKHLKDRSHNAKIRRSGEISSRIFETYKNSVQPYWCHCRHVHGKMCPCTSKYHALQHYKCVLRCYGKFPSIALPSQEENEDITNSCSTIIFHVYHDVSHYTVHGQNS